MAVIVGSLAGLVVVAAIVVIERIREMRRQRREDEAHRSLGREWPL